MHRKKRGTLSAAAPLLEKMRQRMVIENLSPRTITTCLNGPRQLMSITIWHPAKSIPTRYSPAWFISEC